MPFVADVSAMMPWVFEDEDHPVASAAFDRTAIDIVIVPALWWFELRNALIMGERRKRIAPDKTQMFLSRLARLDVEVDRSPDDATVLGLTRLHRLTVYDAAYLELAGRRSIQLATLDSDLLKAAKVERIELVAAPA